MLGLLGIFTSLKKKTFTAKQTMSLIELVAVAV